jgi:hypothetical protein
MSRLAAMRRAAARAVVAGLACASLHAAESPVARDAMPSVVTPFDAAPAVASSAPRAGSAADCPAEPAPPTLDDTMAGMRDATDGGFLWKATKAGRSTWLYGTIHVARKAWMFPGTHVLRALMASDMVALELDPSDPQIVARLQRAIARRPGAPELPPALEARLRAQMAAACIAPSTLAGVRPEMRAVTIEVMEGRRLGLYPAYGIDMFIAGMSRGLKKPIRSLETPESQAELLVSDDPRETERSVGEILDELEGGNGPRILDRLASDWRRGDLDDLGAYADWCGCLATPAQRADFVKLVDDRNPMMANRIDQWHGEGKSLFVAVGSLHMIGDRGLPALLRAKGFAVERIRYDGGR